MVPEIIRYQSPVVHMRRTALCDAELNGKRIKQGDKVAMWYIAGNRDPDEIEDPDRFHHRPRAAAPAFILRVRDSPLRRQPASGDAVWTILWEEILKRFPPIEGVEKPKRAYSNLIHGITEMKVRIPATPHAPAAPRRHPGARPADPRGYDRMVAFEVSIAILNHIAASHLVLAAMAAPSRSRPSGPRRSSRSSGAPERTVRVKNLSACFVPIRELGGQPRLPTAPTTPSRRFAAFR